MMCDVLRGACMVLTWMYGIGGLCTCELRDGLFGKLEDHEYEHEYGYETVGGYQS